MSLQKMMAAATSAAAVQETERPVEHIGLQLFTSEFFTEHRTVRANLISPESRLSDHLNSSVPVIELQNVSLAPSTKGTPANLAMTATMITKDQILFVIPLAEPDRPRGTANVAWKATVKRRCWIGLGPYAVLGTIHRGAGSNANITWRSLDEQFLPMTDAEVTFPGGDVHHYDAILINQLRADLFAFDVR